MLNRELARRLRTISGTLIEAMEAVAVHLEGPQLEGWANVRAIWARIFWRIWNGFQWALGFFLGIATAAHIVKWLGW